MEGVGANYDKHFMKHGEPHAWIDFNPIADLKAVRGLRIWALDPLCRAVTGLAASGIFIIIHFLFREVPASIALF